MFNIYYIYTYTHFDINIWILCKIKNIFMNEQAYRMISSYGVGRYSKTIIFLRVSLHMNLKNSTCAFYITYGYVVFPVCLGLLGLPGPVGLTWVCWACLGLWGLLEMAWI